MTAIYAPRSILITGASSGIGEALARAYAVPGTTLALGGRDRGRRDAVAGRCRAAGAGVSAETVDVTDPNAMARWVGTADGAAPLALVIANAGISAGTGGGDEGADQVRRILAVNVDGVMNTVQPAIRAMRARAPEGGRRGQLAIMSALAAFRGFPGAPAYCASKAAVRVYGEALRTTLASDGIGVSVICPGYVRSRMTANNAFPMPALMDADRAAAIIRRGLARNRARIAFPWRMYAAVWALAALPPALTNPLFARLPRKV